MTLDWILWIALAVTQAAISIIAFRSKLNCVWFPRYIYFVTVKTPILMAVALFGGQGLYFTLYAAGSLIGMVLALMVVGSLWRQTFGPSSKLPPDTLTHFRTLVVSVVCPLAVVLVTFFRARNAHAYLGSLINLETVVLSASGVTLALMIFYSKHLGISWRSKPAGILGGFLWCFGVNWLLMFLAGQEIISIYTAQRIGLVVCLLTFVVWGRVLLQKERAPGVTDDQINRVLREFGLNDLYGVRLRTRESSI